VYERKFQASKGLDLETGKSLVIVLENDKHL
jgi:hypothetical protein